MIAVLAESKTDHGIAASCLLSALGTDEKETEAETIRAHVGGLLLAEALRDIRMIRKVWTKAAK